MATKKDYIFKGTEENPFSVDNKDFVKKELSKPKKGQTWELDKNEDGSIEAVLSKRVKGEKVILSNRTLDIVGGEDGYVLETIKGRDKLPDLTESERRFRRVLGPQGLEDRGHKGESLQEYDFRTLDQPQKGYASSYVDALGIPENLGSKIAGGIKKVGRTLGIGREKDTRPDPIRFLGASPKEVSSSMKSIRPTGGEPGRSVPDNVGVPITKSLQQSPVASTRKDLKEVKAVTSPQDPKDKWADFAKIDRWTQKWSKVKDPDRRKKLFNSMLEGAEKNFLADYWNLR